MKFSQRLGIAPIKSEIQIRSMDDDLRNAIWNTFQVFYLDKIKFEWISETSFNSFFRALWSRYFKKPIDTMENYYEGTYKEIRKYYFGSQWFEVYDFIEFVANTVSPVDNEKFKTACNMAFERELSAYRFVDKHIIEITDQTQISAIEQALNDSKKTKLTGAQEHLQSSLSKLSDRKNPDYRNSIKESISAVESVAKLISGNPKAELGQALKIIEEKIGLHQALKKGFSAIYGYASDSDGIRHALMENSEVDFEDSKYMLVSCAAFISYLIMKSKKAGISMQ